MKFFPLILAAAAALAQEPTTPVPATPPPKRPAAVAQQSDTPIPPPPATASGPRVLLVGGGVSHDYQKWFNEVDRAILAPLQPAYLEYTDNPNGVPAVLANIDLLVWSSNLPMASATARAITEYAAAGKPILVLHAGAWYSWKNFPEWNREIVGGGASKHDKIAEFEVEVLDGMHPLLAGLPAKFKVTDELYQAHPEPGGSPITVLAQATNPTTGTSYPSIWTVQHPQARIVCICIGHDGRVHNLPEYRLLLANAYRWLLAK